MFEGKMHRVGFAAIAGCAVCAIACAAAIVAPAQAFADDASEYAAETKELARKLAAEARQYGIHLLFATQKAVKENIDTTITSNIPSRIALQCTSRQDSLALMHGSGAERLSGNGDAYFHPHNGLSIRMQCAFASQDEIERAKEMLRVIYPA